MTVAHDPPAAQAGSGYIGPRSASACLALPAAGLDALLIWRLGAGALSPGVFALLHLALCCGAGIAAACLMADRTQAVLLGFGLAVMGPFGAAGALLVALGDPGTARGRPELEEWYRRLSGEAERNAAEIREEDILEGRAYRPTRDSTENFARVLWEGSVAERQAVLGLLVQHDEQGALELMTAALRSRDVAVRASAAAAIARMRETAARPPPSGEGAS